MTLTTAPELLMPAGDFQKMRFAFHYGADAVYAGVPIFSLRARENSFKKDTIKEAIEYAHARGKKVYLTMNIYAHNSKIDRFLDSFCEMADLNPDGFIMTDPGLIGKAMKARPEAIIHLSTQANATNWATVEFWRDLGVKRVILPRELSVKEIAVIRDKVSDIELECFVHGALCIAYSGRCLISNYLNHRDANQGTCTNSCRWEYKIAVDKGSLVEADEPVAEYQPLVADYKITEAKRTEKQFIQEQFGVDEDENGTYLFNSKDLCAVELLETLNKAGICSFKVEGRSKSIYYVATVARAYRRAIDDMVAGRPFNADNLLELVSTANRTMMTGFLERTMREYGENFDDGRSLPLTHRYAGVALEEAEVGQEVSVDFKNRVEIGDTLQWITPTETITQIVTHLAKPNGESVDVAHGGIKYLTPAPASVDEFTIVRQVLPVSDLDSEDGTMEAPKISQHKSLPVLQ